MSVSGLTLGQTGKNLRTITILRIQTVDKAAFGNHPTAALRVVGHKTVGSAKGLLQYRKTRYRGLQTQTAKLNMMFALANLILADRPCLAV
jgi:hypothetical protein